MRSRLTANNGANSLSISLALTFNELATVHIELGTRKNPARSRDLLPERSPGYAHVGKTWFMSARVETVSGGTGSCVLHSAVDVWLNQA